NVGSGGSGCRDGQWNDAGKLVKPLQTPGGERRQPDGHAGQASHGEPRRRSRFLTGAAKVDRGRRQGCNQESESETGQAKTQPQKSLVRRQSPPAHLGKASRGRDKSNCRRKTEAN